MTTNMRQWLLAIVSAALLAACGGGGGGGSSNTPGGSTPPPPAASLTLTVGPLSLASGGRSTLSWSTTGATSCEASGGWSGARATTGSEQTPPLTATTTFTLSCSGASGQVSRSATIEVSGAPLPTLSLAADPGTVVAGGRTTLFWSSTGTTSCDATGGWTGARATAGSVQSDPLVAATTFSLVCSGPGGQVSRSTSVNVSSSPMFVVGGTVAGLAGSMTLQLNSAGNLVVSASGPFEFPVPLANGAAFAVTIVQQPTGRTCAIENGSGTIAGANVSNLIVTCVPVPEPAVIIAANPGTVAPNGTTLLTWSSTNATNCEARGGWSGPRPTTGFETVGPLASTTSFELICTGPGGTGFARVDAIVEVIQPPTLSLTSLSKSVNTGREGTVFWNTTGVTSCVASGGWSGSRSVGGEERVAVPGRRAEFTLQCEGPGGSVSDTISIRRNALCQRPVIDFEITPASIAPGGSSTLHWNTGNATQCTATRGWSGARGLMGSETVGPLTVDTTFALTCDGDVGRSVYARRVGINRQAPSIVFQALYSEADPGSTAGNGLVWSVENASSCTASGSWSGIKGLSGHHPIPNVTSPTTFGLSCTGNGTTTEAELSVTPLVRTNLPPIAQSDIVNLDKGQPFTLLDLGEAYFANDEDPDGCVASFSFTPKNSWGVWMTTYFSPDDEHMWFRALDDLTGELREHYAIYDNHGRGSGAVATLRIAGGSGALLLEPDRASVIAGSGFAHVPMTANDRGIDASAQVKVSRAPTNGRVAIGIASVGLSAPYVSNYYFAQYTPTAGFTGIDSFDYEVVNADGQRASTAVTIDVRSSSCIADGTLTAPLAGTAGLDWRTVQFPDMRPVVGQAADARGGPFVRDQGRRTDFLVGDLDDTYRPISVLAMQCGRVIGRGDDYVDNSPSDKVPDAALLVCGNYITIERHDGTRDQYCNLRIDSGGPRVGAEVMEGQYLGRAGYSAGYPGLRIEITAPDGQTVDLLSAPGAFDLAYPAIPEIVEFGVTTTDDPRSQVSPAVLRPASSLSIHRDAVPVLWYRVFGVPSTTQRRLSIEDGKGARVWQVQFDGASSSAGVFAYIAESTATRTVSPKLSRLPPGTYTAILELPSFPLVSARTTFAVAN